MFYDISVGSFWLSNFYIRNTCHQSINFLRFLAANVRKRCGLGAAYHDGTMVNRDAQAGSPSECLAKCNADDECEFWDYGRPKDDGDRKIHCRLRSNDKGGPKFMNYFAYGSKYCTFGNACNTLIKAVG